MTRCGSLGLILILTFISTTQARSESLSGNYVSLDGTKQYQFSISGDYRGNTKAGSVFGVYRQGPNICWLTRNDGAKQYGDLVLYIDEVQCCLQIETISDKHALTQIWVKGTGPGYQLCQNQVLRKDNK